MTNIIQQLEDLKEWSQDSTRYERRLAFRGNFPPSMQTGVLPIEFDELSPQEQEYYQNPPFSTHPDFLGAKGGSAQLVQPGPPGVRQGYGDWNVGKGELNQPYLYKSRSGKRTGKGYFVQARKGDESIYKHFPPDQFEKAKDFAKKTEKRLKNIPAQTTRISGQRLTVANKYAEYFYDEDDFHKLKFKHKNRILAKMEREENRFIKKSQHDLPSATNQEKIKNAFPDVEFDFKPGKKHGVPYKLKNGKTNPAYGAVAHFMANDYKLPKQNIKKLPVSMQREIVSTFELPPGAKEWNFDVTRGGTRYGISGTAAENQQLYQRIKYFTKDPMNFKIAADYATPNGWLLSSMYRAWNDGHESYKPVYDTINGKKKIVGFTDNQFGKGKTYFGLKKYTKKFNGTPMSDHPDFKNTKKFIDIANKAKLPPNKVIADLLIKGGIEDNRVTLNTLLNYMVNEKGVEQTHRALVLHHKGGAKLNPTRDLQILNRAINQNIMGIETKMRADPKNITPKNIQFLKESGASITIDGKTYGGGPKTALGGFREAEKLVQSKLEGYGKKDFAKLNRWIKQLGCGLYSGGRVDFANAGKVDCFGKGLEKIKTKNIVTRGDAAVMKKIVQTGAKKGAARTALMWLGPLGLGGDVLFEAGDIAVQMLGGKPLDESLRSNWITGAFIDQTEKEARDIKLFKETGPGAKRYVQGSEAYEKLQKMYKVLQMMKQKQAGSRLMPGKEITDADIKKMEEDVAAQERYTIMLDKKESAFRGGAGEEEYRKASDELEDKRGATSWATEQKLKYREDQPTSDRYKPMNIDISLPPAIPKEKQFDTIEKMADYFIEDDEWNYYKDQGWTDKTELFTEKRKQMPEFNKQVWYNIMNYGDPEIKGSGDSFFRGTYDQAPTGHHFAGGGIAGIRRPWAIPPESGPDPQGIIPRPGYGLGDIVKKHIPAEYRLYAKSILPGGESGKVGSDYFTEDFKQDLRRQALEKYTRTGELTGHVGELDQHRGVSSINKLTGFPSTYASLGTYTYDVDPETLDVNITDRYDWNPHYGTTKIGDEDFTGWIGDQPDVEQGDVDLSLIKDYVVNAVKNKKIDKAAGLELIGNYFGGKASEGKGFDIDIDIPIQEATPATEGSFAGGGLSSQFNRVKKLTG